MRCLVAAQLGRVKACSFTHASCGRPTYSRSLWSLAYDMECWGGLSSSTRVITRLEVFSRMAAWRPFRILPALISFTGWRWVLPYFYWSEELKDAWGSIVISEIRGSLSQTIKKKMNLNWCREIDALFCVWYILCVRETVHIFQKHAHTHNQVNLSWWSPHHRVINRNHVCQFEQHFGGCDERLRDRILKRIADVSQDDVYLQNVSLS